MLLGVAMFAATNIDDLFVLIAILATGRMSSVAVLLGHMVGIATLFAGGVLLSMGAGLVPEGWMGFLGLIPIAIGLRRLTAGGPDDEVLPAGLAFSSVVAVTLANGADNLAVYGAAFATRNGAQLLALAATFAAMSTFWFGVAAWLVRHPLLGVHLRRLGPRLLPWVLIALGAWILWAHGVA